MSELNRVLSAVAVARSLLTLHAHALRYGYYSIAEEYAASAKRWAKESTPRLIEHKKKGQPEG